MAEESKTKKDGVRVRKPETMREKNVKASSTADKPRRIKKTASAASKPIKAAAQASKKEYHLFPQSNSGVWGFFTKSRKLTPGYFRSAYKELKNVTWPNRKETWRLMIAVFIFSIAFGLAITLVDFVLDKLFKRAFL